MPVSNESDLNYQGKKVIGQSPEISNCVLTIRER